MHGQQAVALARAGRGRPSSRRSACAQIETAIGARGSHPTRGAEIWPALAAGLAALAVLFGGLCLGQRPDRRSTVNDRPIPAANSYELWMLPEGRAPVSLGLLPGTGNAALPLDAEALAVLAQTMTLAVSLEPAGGSPTGAPTGPVLFTAPLLRV